MGAGVVWVPQPSREGASSQCFCMKSSQLRCFPLNWSTTVSHHCARPLHRYWPEGMGQTCTKGGMMEPGKPRGCLQVVMPWAQLDLHGAGRWAQGSTTLTLMEQHAALLIRRSLRGRNLNLIPFCQAKGYMRITDGLTFSTQCLGHLVHTQQ